MDSRRLLILACASLGLSGCAALRELRLPISVPDAPAPFEATPPPPVEDAVISLGDPLDAGDDETAIVAPTPAGGPTVTGQRAIAVANLEARAASRSDAFVGGVQVFAWAPGRVYEIWTTPLRVTTLTLGPGESLVVKAAGDTVRWQVGETTSGEGAGRRSHVLIKPLERGLETNLVLTTNRRVYYIDLKSAGADGFNAAVAWDAAGLDGAAGVLAEPARREVRVPDAVAQPEGPLDARYAIEPRGRRPRWTPASVFNDGRRTFIAFAADLQVDEAPALFVLSADGEAQLVNYRQSGGLFIVDRVFDRAELRLGGRRPQVVQLRRLQGDVR